MTQEKIDLEFSPIPDTAKPRVGTEYECPKCGQRGQVIIELPSPSPSAGAEAMRKDAIRVIREHEAAKGAYYFTDADYLISRIEALPTAPTESQSAQATAMREALEFYADPRIYAVKSTIEHDQSGVSSMIMSSCAAWDDGGERAREVLAALPPSGETGEEK